MPYSGQNNLLGSWIKNDEQLAIANTFSEKRIREYDSNDMVRLVELMARWRLLLGVTSDVSTDELTFICQFLYDNFKNFTLGDMTLAMNWAISGRTDVGFVSQKTLSSFYVSKCIQAYVDEKKTIVDNIAWEKQKQEDMAKRNLKPEMTPEIRANNFKSHLISVHRGFQESGRIIDFGDMVYNWLKRSKIYEISKQEVSDALAYANDKFIEERNQENTFKLIIQPLDPQTEEIRKKKLAREYILLQVFSKIEITELILKINPKDFNNE